MGVPWNTYQFVVKNMVRAAKCVQHPLESCLFTRYAAGVLVAAVLVHADGFAISAALYKFGEIIQLRPTTFPLQV